MSRCSPFCIVTEKHTVIRIQVGASLDPLVILSLKLRWESSALRTHPFISKNLTGMTQGREVYDPFPSNHPVPPRKGTLSHVIYGYF